jgi:hypothetical protein
VSDTVTILFCKTKSVACEIICDRSRAASLYGNILLGQVRKTRQSLLASNMVLSAVKFEYNSKSATSILGLGY